MIAATVALAYAAAAYAATRFARRLCRDIEPFADGPRSSAPSTLFLICAAATVGAVLAVRHASLTYTCVAGLLAAALAAGAYCDLKCGIVPDECTLVPLAAVLALSLFARDLAPSVSAAIVFALFALAALASHGRGLGWGDVKLAALVAAVLGLQTTLVATCAALLVAAASALIRRRKSEPIAFAPYLAGSAAAALMLPLSMW